MSNIGLVRRSWRIVVVGVPAAARYFQPHVRHLRIVLAGAATAGMLAGLSVLNPHWVVLAVVGAAVYAGALRRFQSHRTISEAPAR